MAFTYYESAWLCAAIALLPASIWPDIALALTAYATLDVALIFISHLRLGCALDE